MCTHPSRLLPYLAALLLCACSDDGGLPQDASPDKAPSEMQVVDAPGDDLTPDGAKADVTKADATKADATKADTAKPDAAKVDGAKADTFVLDMKSTDGTTCSSAACAGRGTACGCSWTCDDGNKYEASCSIGRGILKCGCSKNGSLLLTCVVTVGSCSMKPLADCCAFPY